MKCLLTFLGKQMSFCRALWESTCSLSVPASICMHACLTITVSSSFRTIGFEVVRCHRQLACHPPPPKAVPRWFQTDGYQNFPLAKRKVSKMETKQHPLVSRSKGWESSVPANHFVVALDALCCPVVSWKSLYRRAFIAQRLHLAFWVTVAHAPNQRKALRGF